jgi:hypothetical protein
MLMSDLLDVHGVSINFRIAVSALAPYSHFFFL